VLSLILYSAFQHRIFSSIIIITVYEKVVAHGGIKTYAILSREIVLFLIYTPNISILLFFLPFSVLKIMRIYM